MKAQVDVVTISPKKAAEYLENVLDGQRKVREGWVKTLADDMRTGRFRLSCDAIVLLIGADGIPRLANGQHRMWGVVESNTSQPFILMRTDDKDLYKVIDSGQKRSVADATGIINGPSVSALANLAIAYQKKTITAFSFAKATPRVVLIEYVEQNGPKLSEAVNLASRLTSQNMNLVAKSVPGSFAYLAWPVHGEKVDAFLGHVYTGDMPESICSVLRDRYLKARMSKTTGLPSQMSLALMIKAFNAHVTGSKTSTLRMVDGETFPQIIKAQP